METTTVFSDLPTLETERLVLRKLNLADAPDMFEFGSDPQVVQYTTWQVHSSIQDAQAFLRSVVERYAGGQVAPWGLVLKNESKLIGTCGFVTWLPNFARAEVGYALSRRYWGRGLMTEAVRAVVAFGFLTMQVNRLQAVCDVDNTASAHVLEKVGMTYEGTLREYGFAKGRFRNLRMYSILRSEWVQG